MADELRLDLRAALWCFAVRPARDELCIIIAGHGRHPDAEEIWDDAVFDNGSEADCHTFGSPGGPYGGPGAFVWEGSYLTENDRHWFEGKWRRARESEVIAWHRWCEAQNKK